jgi:rhodanese-related sulfurtransferase
MKKKFILLLCLLLMIAPVFPAVAQSDAVLSRLNVYNLTLPEGYGVTSVEAVAEQIAQNPATLLLDVRQPEEYAAGHLANSFNVPIRELGQNLDLLPDLHADIVVICQSGGRATLAATALGVLGYDHVKILKGGFGAWDAAEMPSTADVFTAEASSAPEIDADVFEAVDTYLSTLPEGFGFVSAQNLAVELASDAPPIVIDVRSMNEWNGGYIESAQHIWVNEFMGSQDQWPADKDANIVIYCASGYRGSIATVLMNLAGYTHVRNLSGGAGAWTAAGFPLVGAVEAEESAFDLNAYLTSYVSELPGSFNAVRVDDLAAELASDTPPMLVDVRTTGEYADGFIAGAVNIPLQELTQHLDLLPDLEANIVVYCGSGHRSAIAMTSLNLLGYKNVRSLIGGFGAWKTAEQPVSNEVPEMVMGSAPSIEPAVFDVVNNFVTSIPAGYYTVKAIDLQVELTQDTPAPVVIDVRTDSEWQQGYIDGSLHMNLSDFMVDEPQWPTDKTTPIVIYDNPTHRSTIAMTLMRLLGYDNVRVLAGGTTAWTSNQLPLVTQ